MNGCASLAVVQRAAEVAGDVQTGGVRGDHDGDRCERVIGLGFRDDAG
ncbi:hypothetical protein [Arthrobacter roseus]|nr:hypothetical protein [Arthrobacter roseus]